MSYKLSVIFLFLLIFTACSRTPAPDAAGVVDTAATASPSSDTEPPAAEQAAAPATSTATLPAATPPAAEATTSAPTEPSATEPSATSTVTAGLAPLALSLVAAPETLSPGACTTLTWEVTGAAAVWLYAETESFAQNSAEHAGSAEFCPDVTTTYELRAQAAAGPPRVEQVVVTVTGSAATAAGTAAEAEPTAAGAAVAITGANPLGGSLWQVTAVDGAPLVPGAVVAALFGRDGTVNINGGCNTFIGSYQAGSDAVSIATLPAPTLTCGEALMAQERLLVTALQASVGLEQADGQLVFRDAAGEETVRFQKP